MLHRLRASTALLDLPDTSPAPLAPLFYVHRNHRPSVYMNTREKYTQWERPSQRAAPPSGGRGTVREVDAPRMTCHRSFTSNDSSGTGTSNTICNAVPRTNPLWSRVSSVVRNVSRVERHIPNTGDAELPENWHKRETPEGRVCENCSSFRQYRACKYLGVEDQGYTLSGRRSSKVSMRSRRYATVFCTCRYLWPI